jgi:hypothetical protein
VERSVVDVVVVVEIADGEDGEWELSGSRDGSRGDKRTSKAMD